MLRGMKAFFKDMDPQAIVAALTKAMAGRKLADLTRLAITPTAIVATVSKMGTSTLTFTTRAQDGGTEVSLTEEKLALTHRPLRSEVKDKFVKLVEKAGGVVTQRS